MGTDIHIHIEVKHKGEWLHWANPFLQRNYRAFALLCGVRNDDSEFTPIMEPNGIPEDATLPTKLDLSRENHHHDGCANAEQFNKWWDFLETENIPQFKGGHGPHNVFGYLMGNGFHPNAVFEDIRMIYWFDC